jgi:diadenosine tetraphosphate (Ap4A) HIT family hydrolase
MEDWRNDRIGSAERGDNPMVIARMASGFAVIGDTQFLPGYCLLLASPQVDQLSDLPLPARLQFLRDMSLLGEAIQRACRPGGLHRLNYEILGNSDAYLHAHLFPRYGWENPELLGGPVWHYPRNRWTDAHDQYQDEEHGVLRARISAALQAVLCQAGEASLT